MKEVDEIVAWMRANAGQAKDMERVAINTANALGLPMPLLRTKAREYRRRHDVALALWDTGIHEARIMASLVDDPKQVSSEQVDAWSADFDSWDMCDQCCINLFRLTPFAHDKITAYAADGREFVRRTAFVLIATLAVHDKASGDNVFIDYLPLIERYSCDERNFVRKAVNWALRQIGKRNLNLNTEAVITARRLADSPDPSERWIGRDALRELTSPKTLEYIRNHRKS